jgi:polysaccharide pyruvyl transferase WcaK-like protein
MCGPALNQSNTGDRLLVSTLARILRQDLGIERITYASVAVDPRVKEEIPSLEVIDPRRQLWRLLWRAFRADAFVIAGAVSFHEHRRVMLKQAVLAWLCRLGGGRTVVNAVSIQPIRDRICRLLFRATYAAANWFTVRDQDSIVHAKAMGIRQSTQRSPDPGIICPAAPAERVKQILAAETVPTDRPLFCIVPHLFINHGRYQDPDYAGFEIEYQDYPDAVLDRYYEVLARVADWLTERGTVVFLPMCTKTPPGDDRVAADWVRRRMSRAGRTFSVQGEYTAGELAGILSHCTLLISSRLHGYAMGVANGVPSLAVEFHPKMRGMAEEIELTDWVFPISSLQTEPVCRTVTKILADLPAARESVRVGVDRAAAKARSDFLHGITGQPIRRAA